MRIRRFFASLLVLAALGSCHGSRRTESSQARENMSPEVTAQLDSGNVAFRSHDYEAALAHYTRAVELAPDVGAAWFGVYMAQDAMGNDEAAADALERAQALVPGAKLLHDDGSGGQA